MLECGHRERRSGEMEMTEMKMFIKGTYRNKDVQGVFTILGKPVPHKPGRRRNCGDTMWVVKILENPLPADFGRKSPGRGYRIIVSEGDLPAFNTDGSVESVTQVSETQSSEDAVTSVSDALSYLPEMIEVEQV